MRKLRTGARTLAGLESAGTLEMLGLEEVGGDVWGCELVIAVGVGFESELRCKVLHFLSVQGQEGER